MHKLNALVGEIQKTKMYFQFVLLITGAVLLP